MTKPTVLTTPEINPKTGHEDSLPPPRSRDEIYREMLASHQADLQPFVDNELNRINRCAARNARRKSN